jgi:P27 family predicted phage terminase small subunit
MAEPQPAMSSEPPLAPEWLPLYARQEWERLAGELHRLRLLTILDHAVFGGYCVAYGMWRMATEAEAAAGEDVKPVLARIASRAANDMVKFASEFGLTPASRTRLGLPGLPSTDLARSSGVSQAARAEIPLAQEPTYFSKSIEPL